MPGFSLRDSWQEDIVVISNSAPAGKRAPARVQCLATKNLYPLRLERPSAASASQVTELLRAFIRKEDDHFLKVALQVAAVEAQRGPTSRSLKYAGD